MQFGISLDFSFHRRSIRYTGRIIDGLDVKLERPNHSALAEELARVEDLQSTEGTKKYWDTRIKDHAKTVFD